MSKNLVCNIVDLVAITTATVVALVAAAVGYGWPGFVAVWLIFWVGLCVWVRTSARPDEPELSWGYAVTLFVLAPIVLLFFTVGSVSKKVAAKLKLA